MQAVGVGKYHSDNGTGVRNAAIKSTVLGILGQCIDSRTYHSTDNSIMERGFGTFETQLFSLIHGYTGRRAGQLTGYDPIKNGVLDVEQLYGIVTRYLVDVYPNNPHHGVTMMGHRPIDVFHAINDDHGSVIVPTDHDRRIHLGWRVECSITDDGVKAFNLPFTSGALQAIQDDYKGKVSVYIDPDDISKATVLAVGHKDPILVDLTWTAMKDLTLPQFLEVSMRSRAESPEARELAEDNLVSARKSIADQLDTIALEHKLSRSFMTCAEAETKAKVIRSGLHSSAKREDVKGTVAPGSVGKVSSHHEVRKVGKGRQSAIDHVPTAQPEIAPDEKRLPVPQYKGKLK
jgi:hypothetical protein